MPAAMRDQIGVALAQLDELVRHAELVGEDLREGRLVTLADMLGPSDQRHRTVRLEADIDILRRVTAGALDVIREAEPAQFALRLAERTSRGEAGHVGRLQGALESLRKG